MIFVNADSETSKIVEFWLGDSVESPEAAEGRRPFWYQGGEQLDDDIRQHFGELVARACAGEMKAWEQSGEGALALVILLDQFTRNLYRGTPAAYSGDARAYEIAEATIAAGLDRHLPVSGRIFLYHPYHHSETLSDQQRSVDLVNNIRIDVPDHWHEYLDRRAAGFARHRDIVAEFGRFPHRNAILKRADTPAERAFLDAGAEHFGQQASR